MLRATRLSGCKSSEVSMEKEKTASEKKAEAIEAEKQKK